MSGTEAKPEVKDEDDDSNSGTKQTDVKMEVCSCIYKKIQSSAGKTGIVEVRDGKIVLWFPFQTLSTTICHFCLYFMPRK